MSVIKDLYEGQVGFSQSVNPGTLEYKEAKNLEESLYDTFYPTLSPEQKVLYEAFEGRGAMWMGWSRRNASGRA